MENIIKRSVARESVERNGVDVDKLLGLMVRTALSELANYYYYTILSINLIGAEGDRLKKIVDNARQEDHRHFEALIPRIYELGGRLPVNTSDLKQGLDPSLNAYPADLTNIRTTLEMLTKSAESSVRSYTDICNMTCGKDNRTYGLALAILHEEIEHQVWFLEFVGHHPSKENFAHEEQRGNSPFVSKFLQSWSTPTGLQNQLLG